MNRAISNEEFEYIAEYLNIDKQIIFREGEVFVDEKQKIEQQKTKLNRWLSTDCSLEELRGAISEASHYSVSYLPRGYYTLNSTLNQSKLTSN